MNDKIQIQLQANVESGSSEIRRLQEQLDDLAKKLKLNISTVNILGQKTTSSNDAMAKSTQTAAKANNIYENSLNKLLFSYKKKQVADEDMIKRLNEFMKTSEFKELSDQKQIQVINALTKAEKNYNDAIKTKIATQKTQQQMSQRDIDAEKQKIADLAKFKAAMRDQKRREFDNDFKEAIQINKQIDAQREKDKQANAQKIADQIAFNNRMRDQKRREFDNDFKEAQRINRQIDDLAQKRQQKIYSLNSGQASTVRIFDDTQRESVQTSAQGRILSARQRLSTVEKSGVFNSEEIFKVSNGLDDLEKRISKITNNKMAQKFETDFNKISQSIKTMGAEADKSKYSFSNLLETGITKMAVWSIAATAFYAPIRAFQSMIQYTIEMDTALTDLSKVVPYTKEQLIDMKDAALEMGGALGKSSTEVMKAMAEFGRVTKDPQAIKDLTNAALVASNVTTLTADQAAKAINTTMIAFKMDAKDAIKIVDAWNEVQNNFRKLVRK